MAESWGQLAANAAALKAGDLDGLSSRATVRQAACGGGVGWGGVWWGVGGEVIPRRLRHCFGYPSMLWLLQVMQQHVNMGVPCLSWVGGWGS
jgi:hypothetical protein